MSSSPTITPPTITPPTKPLANNAFTRWVDRHDDTWLFTIIYVSLAVSLSLSISLFWLLVVATAHASLEWYALSRAGVAKPRRKIKQILWHLRLDLVIILFALWVDVYMTALFGVLGLNAVARTTTVARAARATSVPIHDIINTLSLVIDDILLVLRGLARRKPRGVSGDPEPLPTTVPHAASDIAPDRLHPWVQLKRLPLGDKALFLGAATLIITLALSPLLTHHTSHEIIQMLASNLHPWP